MEQKPDIDALIKTTLKSEGLASPPKHFTDRVMSSLPDPASESKSYKPLLPGKAIAMIIGFSIIIIAVSFFIPNVYTVSFLKPSFTDRLLNVFKNIQIRIDIPMHISSIIAFLLLLVFMQTFFISKFIRKVH